MAIRSFRTARRSFTAFRLTAKRYACHTERGEGSCDKGMGNDLYAFPFGEGGFGGKCLHFASKTDEVFTRSAPRLCRYTGAKPSTKDLIRHLLRNCRLLRACRPRSTGACRPVLTENSPLESFPGVRTTENSALCCFPGARCHCGGEA